MSLKVFGTFFLILVLSWGVQIPPLEAQVLSAESDFNLVKEDQYILEVASGDKVNISLVDNKPVLRLEKWTDAFLEIIIPEDIGKPSLEDNKLFFDSEKVALDISSITPGLLFSDGGVRFDIILKEELQVNYVNLPFKSENLEFFYQGELTEEEVKQGDYRPPEIIGSYAVYHSSKKGNEYKTGKAFHILRPLIIDSLNRSIPGDLYIDKDQGFISIVIDQEWLDKAVYPITVDPSIGYDTIGASSQNPDPERLRAQREYLPQNSFINNVAIYIKDVCWYGSIKFAIYDDGAGNLPYNLEGESTNVTCSVNTWVNASTYTATLPPQYVYLAFWASDDWSNCKIAYDSGVLNRSVYGGVRTFNGFIDPWTGQKSNGTNIYSIYANYTLVVPQYALILMYHSEILEVLLNGSSKDSGESTLIYENYVANLTSIADVGFNFLDYRDTSNNILSTDNPFYHTMTANATIHSVPYDSGGGGSGVSYTGVGFIVMILCLAWIILLLLFKPK